MDSLAQWQTAWVLLTRAALVFHDARFNLQAALPQYTPASAQRAYLQQIITSHYPTIKLIQAKMADLPLVMNQILNLSIPVSRIPAEILASIFDIALITSSTPDRPWYHRHDVLTTISSEYNRVVPDIMNLCAGHGGLNSVKTIVWFVGENHPERPVTFLPFTGLVTFELGWFTEHQCLTIDQIIAVLISNPSIQTLRLRNMKTRFGPGSTASPIELPALQLLDLVGLDGAAAGWLMSSLLPGRRELDVRLELLGSVNFERAVAQFLERSNVVALWLHDIAYRTGALPVAQLPVLPSVRVLGLVSAQRSLNIAAGMFARAGKTQIVRYPNLRTLYLRAPGSITNLGRSRITQVADAYPSVAVHLDNCSFNKPSRSGRGGTESLLLPDSLLRPVLRVFFVNVPLDQTSTIDMFMRMLVEGSKRA
ncbi:hypothetical protein FRC10_004376 [Ceratobasidium sp. 414]|nr:hypothetical protein FRC10_004376 [Ceratobasidium sp. 414]